MNHSCDPTTWFVDEYRMVARKDIKAGDEITYDYGTSELLDSAHVKAGWDCACGAKECRKRLTGKEWEDPAFRSRFEGHFVPNVQERINVLAQ